MTPRVPLAPALGVSVALVLGGWFIGDWTGVVVGVALALVWIVVSSRPRPAR